MTAALKPAAHAGLTDEFREFINTNWTLERNAQGWHDALRGNGWLCADWPAAAGGPGWDRTAQWFWAKACSEALCPLPTDEFGILAPLLMGVGTDEQKSHLAGIRAGQAWEFHFSPNTLAFDGGHLDGELKCGPSSNLCLLVGDQLLLLPTTSLSRQKQEGGTLRFRGYRTCANERLGCGDGTRHLALNQSAFCNLVTQLSALVRLRNAIREDGPLKTKLHALEIAVSAGEAMFLQRRSRLLLNLSHAATRADTINLLGDAIGYYLLLEPAPGETANEPPLPFAAERALLESLQGAAERDVMVQKDFAYQRFLATAPDAQ